MGWPASLRLGGRPDVASPGCEPYRAAMKSAYELAMERLQSQAPTKALTPEQKAELAELDSIYKAKVAQREIALGDSIQSAIAAGDYVKAEELREQLVHERARLEEEREERKDRVRQGG